MITMKHLFWSRIGNLWGSVDSPMHNYFWVGEEQNGIFQFWPHSFPVLGDACTITGASAKKFMIQEIILHSSMQEMLHQE